MVCSPRHPFAPELFRLRGAGHRANVGHHRAAISGAYGSSAAYGYAGIQLWMDGDVDGLVLPHCCCLWYCASSHGLASPVYPGHWSNYCTENGIVSLVLSYVISSEVFCHPLVTCRLHVSWIARPTSRMLGMVVFAIIQEAHDHYHHHHYHHQHHISKGILLLSMILIMFLILIVIFMVIFILMKPRLRT